MIWIWKGYIIRIEDCRRSFRPPFVIKAVLNLINHKWLKGVGWDERLTLLECKITDALPSIRYQSRGVITDRS